MSRLTKIVIALAIAWLVLWGLASFAVPKIFDRVLPKVAGKVQQIGIAVQEMKFEGLEVSPSLLRVKIQNFNAKFDLKPKDRDHLRSRFDATETQVYITRPLRMRGGVVVDNFEMLFHPSDRPKRFPFDGFTKGYMHIHSLPLLDPNRAAVEIIEGLEKLFMDNELVGDFEFSGEVLVRIDDSTVPALIYTERQGERFRLRFSRPDIEKIAESADVVLSDEQIDLVSLYPVRVPALIMITDQARDYSHQEFPKQHWLQDALRHISWSYLLTKEFGSDFAKQVTDAHEINPGNTPDEHAMDYHNNAVGRRFATDGTTFEELPLQVLAHEDVIRDPNEVETKAELLR